MAISLADRLMRDTLYDEIKTWISTAPGEFSASDLDRDFCLTAKPDRANRTAALEQLVADGFLERVGNRRGFYRPRQNQLVPMDLEACKDEPVNLWLPFEITHGPRKLVNLFAGNIVTVAGEKNSGKTAFLLNTAITNRNGWVVHYFNSEMPGPELLTRLKLFRDYDLGEWKKVNFYERHRDFSDVVFSGPRDLNIIDFLELSDEFWRVGQMVRDIYDKLGQGLAIIAIQKKRGSEDPRGGEFVKEKSRLHLDLMNCDGDYPHKIRINPGKNWAQENVNPNWLYAKYKLAGGHFFKVMQDGSGGIWFKEKK